MKILFYFMITDVYITLRMIGIDLKQLDFLFSHIIILEYFGRMDNNIILEYNETTRSFHFNADNHKENTFGYQTVGKNVPFDKASFFANKMETKYGFRRNTPKDLPMKTVLSEWKYFNDVLKLGFKKKEKWL